MDEQKSKRGFASMSPEKQREIASKGGKKAHADGKAHRFTSEKAREAGRKGGKAVHAKGTAHKFTPAEAAAAGRKGGLASHGGDVKTAEILPVGDVWVEEGGWGYGGAALGPAVTSVSPSVSTPAPQETPQPMPEHTANPGDPVQPS